MSKEWAAKVERAANDPERIERRKGIAPALTVPRSRHEDACIWELAEAPCPECAATIQECADQDDSNFSDRTVTYLSADVLAEMEASETKIPESHAIKAKELRAKFLAP